jgi:hypothetical protein
MAKLSALFFPKRFDGLHVLFALSLEVLDLILGKHQFSSKPLILQLVSHDLIEALS